MQSETSFCETASSHSSGESNQDEKHSFKNLFSDSKQMVVTGHRGGFSPENTLCAFKQAKAYQLQAVELDIWLTKDDQLAVIHGGKCGEMPPIIGQELAPTVYIFDLTLNEARDHFSKTKVYQQNLESMSSLPDYCSSESDVSIPTLDDVFRLFERQVLVNVEVKTPINSEIHKRYNGQKLVEILFEKLNVSMNAGETLKAVNFSFVSSFDHDWIQSYQAYESEQAAKNLTNFIYLDQRKYEDTLPKQETTQNWAKGANVQLSGASDLNLKTFHQNKQIMGVWVDKAVTKDEGLDFWNSLMDLGVDMFCTDHPLEVIDARTRYYEAIQASSSA